jgi:hypothetical protein
LQLDLSQFRNRDLLLDTNLLLLEVVGSFDYRLIGGKRLETFTVQDLNVLNLLISVARRLITTPGILTETSNLASQINFGRDGFSRFFAHLGVKIKQLDERYESSAIISDHPLFLQLGLTDAAIAHLTQEGMMVLTGDWQLFGHLIKRGVDAENFNHWRA